MFYYNALNTFIVLLSSENLLFWSACESLRNIKDQKLLLAKVEEIFTTYLDVASTHEVRDKIEGVTHSNIFSGKLGFQG